MRTTLLKKMSAIVLATLLVVAMFSGMAFSTSADVDRNYVTTVNVGTNKATTVAGVLTTTGSAVTGCSIDAVYEVLLDDNAPKTAWAVEGQKVMMTISGYAIYLNADAYTTTGQSFTVPGTVFDPAATSPAALTVKITAAMPTWVSAKEALAADALSGTRDYTDFYGYSFVLTDGTTTHKYSDGKATYDVQKDLLFFDSFVPAANVTLTVGGPKISGGVSVGGKSESYSDAGFKATIAYEKNADVMMTEQLRVKTIKSVATTPEVVSPDVELSGRLAGIMFGNKASYLSDNGMVMTSCEVKDGILFINVDMKNNILSEDGMTLTITDAAIKAKNNNVKFTVTDYNQTFTVPLTDGTTGLVRVSLKTNYDNDPAFKADYIVDFVKASAFRSLKGLVSYDAGTVFIDMINARIGQENKIVTWTKDSETAKEKNKTAASGVTYYTFKEFKKDSKNKAYTIADATAKLAMFGYLKNPTYEPDQTNTAVANYWGSMSFYNASDVNGTFQNRLDAESKLFGESGSASLLIYNNGGEEDIQFMSYNYSNAKTIPVEYKDNTYNVPMFHVIASDYTKAIAVGTAKTQAVSTTLTNAGNYSYQIVGSEVGLYELTATEKHIGVTLTSRIDLADADNKAANMAPSKSDIIFVLRAPKGTKFAQTSNGTTTIEEITVPTGTLLSTTDGLVDYYFKLSYATYDDTTVTLKITYANGVYKEMDIKTTWLTDNTKDAYKAFTTTIPTSTIELVESEPVRPIESQPEVSIETSSTGSAVTGSSVGSDIEVPGTGNPFSAVAYLITICVSAIGGISTLVIRKKK